jgi:hypothetical protein
VEGEFSLPYCITILIDTLRMNWNAISVGYHILKKLVRSNETPFILDRLI